MAISKQEMKMKEDKNIINEESRIDMKILDIGCGNNKFKGNKGDIVIGMDRANLLCVDVIHDMEKFPYPFEDEEFDKVVMQHALEHISKENMANIKIIEEVHRLLKKDGVLEVEVPIGHWFLWDPTHKNYVGYSYWFYFSKNSPLNYYSTARFELIESKIVRTYSIRHINAFTPFFNWLYQKNPVGVERLISLLNIDVAVRYVLKKV